MLVDTHCHLYLKFSEEERAGALERAWQAGVQRVVVPGIDLATSREAVRLAEQDPRLYAAVGVHPNDSLTWNEDTLTALRELAGHPKVVAIGEIGLDYYREHAPHEIQKQVLAAQLDLAEACGLPVLLHNRAARADLWPVMRARQERLAGKNHPLAGRPGVFHSFDGPVGEAQETIAAGFFLGISGPVTFKNAPDRQEVVRALPLDMLVIETDAPYLAPHPYRGRRNEPAYVRLVAEKIAELHQATLPAVEQITTRNAARLFQWDNTD